MDARLDTGLPNHPKTVKLKRRLGADACWSLVCLFLWARHNKPDGDLSGMSVEDIEIAAHWDGEEGKLYDALVSVRFIDEDEHGNARLHDWADHNPWSAGSAARSQAARENASKKWGRSLDQANKKKRSERLAEARAKGRHSAGDWQALVGICGGVCVKCGATNIVKDHITPIYKGGSDSIENLQPLCVSCNAAKGPDSTDYRPSDWQERLRDACQAPAPSPSPSPSPSQEQEQKKGAGAPKADPIFGKGLAMLVRKGIPEPQARTFLGKLKATVRNDPIVVSWLTKAEDEDVSHPVQWLSRCLDKHARAGPKPDKAAADCGVLEDLRSELGLAARGNPDGLAEADPTAPAQLTDERWA